MTHKKDAAIKHYVVLIHVATQATDEQKAAATAFSALKMVVKNQVLFKDTELYVLPTEDAGTQDVLLSMKGRGVTITIGSLED